MKKSMSEQPVGVLGLSNRTVKHLIAGGIQTLGDLTQKTEQGLLRIANIGNTSVSKIKDRLAHKRIFLKKEEE